MKRKISLPVFLATALMLASCSGKFAPTADYFKVTPDVLVVQGGKVPVTVDGTFPAKSFPAKALVTITPVLKYEGGETAGTPITLQGSKVKANNKVIGKEGGSFQVKTVYNYQPAMKKSELYLRFTTTMGKKSVTVPDIKVADGVIATETLANAATANPTWSVDKFQRVIKEANEASIHFLIEQATIRKSELQKKEIADLQRKITETKSIPSKQVSSVELSSYASPDGPLSLNERLAADREKATKKLLEEQLKKASAKGEINAQFTPEDWEGFKELVSASDIQDKDLILRVLSMYSDPEKREQEIKNLSAVYKTLAEKILPELRRSKMKVTIDIIGKSDAQLKDLALNNPSSLSVDELLYASNLVSEGDKKVVLQKTSELYPNDYRAFNNLGVIAFKAGNITDAKKFFEKAYTMSNAPEVCSNMALVSLATCADNPPVSS